MSQAGIRLHDTRSGALTALVPREPNVVRMYTCGPTVYNYTHIGHLRPALVGDVLARLLRYRGYRVLWVSNFTDVDDRIIARANEEGITPKEFAGRYINDYLESMEALGIRGVECYARVTDHIPDIVAMVQRLVERGYAYSIEGDVYFAVEAKSDYGKLSGRTLGEMQAGARVAVDVRKRHPMDFALWKAAKPGEPAWASPWGPGRPGWHIECSAMSLRYLGDRFDIHGGGDDLIFPHHENEIAQSEAYTGSEPFVQIWLHNAMVQVGHEKMSKSLGNFVRLSELVRRYPAGALRQFVLSTHYRKPLQYSADAMQEAQRSWSRLVEARAAWREALAGPGAPPEANATNDGAGGLVALAKRAAEGFEAALADDLNTSEAFGYLFELVRTGNRAMASGRGRELGPALAALESCGDLLGLWQDAAVSSGGRREDSSRGLVELLIELRAEARRYRDWATADRIRDGMAGLGIALEDTPQGTRWKWLSESVSASGADGA